MPHFLCTREIADVEELGVGEQRNFHALLSIQGYAKVKL